MERRDKQQSETKKIVSFIGFVCLWVWIVLGVITILYNAL